MGNRAGQPAQGARYLSLRAILAALALLAVAVFISARLTTRAVTEPPLIRADLELGVEFSQPAISPDGTVVAFIANDALAIRRLNESSFTTLPGTSGASHPFFSPAGEWVAFFANGKLKKIPVTGGPVVTLCDAPLGRGGSWASDGRIIASLNSSGGLSSVSAARRDTSATDGDQRRARGCDESSLATSSPRQVPGCCSPPCRPSKWRAIYASLPPTGSAKTLVKRASDARYLSSGHILYSQAGRLFAAPVQH